MKVENQLIYGLDDDTQKKYQTDINKKITKTKTSGISKRKFIKKRKRVWD